MVNQYVRLLQKNHENVELFNFSKKQLRMQYVKGKIVRKYLEKHLFCEKLPRTFFLSKNTQKIWFVCELLPTDGKYLTLLDLIFKKN